LDAFAQYAQTLTPIKNHQKQPTMKSMKKPTKKLLKPTKNRVHLAPANLLVKSKPKEIACDELTVLETFLLLADVGIKNSHKVLIQLYPDFLQEVAQEIKALQKNNPPPQKGAKKPKKSSPM
jgi:hypothetical protein